MCVPRGGEAFEESGEVFVGELVLGGLGDVGVIDVGAVGAGGHRGGVGAEEELVFAAFFDEEFGAHVHLEFVEGEVEVFVAEEEGDDEALAVPADFADEERELRICIEEGFEFVFGEFGGEFGDGEGAGFFEFAQEGFAGFGEGVPAVFGGVDGDGADVMLLHEGGEFGGFGEVAHVVGVDVPDGEEVVVGFELVDELVVLVHGVVGDAAGVGDEGGGDGAVVEFVLQMFEGLGVGAVLLHASAEAGEGVEVDGHVCSCFGASYGEGRIVTG